MKRSLLALLSLCASCDADSTEAPPEAASGAGKADDVDDLDAPCANEARRMGEALVSLSGRIALDVHEPYLTDQIGVDEVDGLVTFVAGDAWYTSWQWLLLFEPATCELVGAHNVWAFDDDDVDPRTQTSGHERTGICEPVAMGAAWAAYTVDAPQEARGSLAMDGMRWNGFNRDGSVEAFSFSFADPRADVLDVLLDFDTCLPFRIESHPLSRG